MNMKTRTIILTLAAALLLTACVQTNPDAQADPGVQTGLSSQSPDAGNPLLPGYFADPTIVEFDGIYYIYATTDNEMLASGAPTLWYSRDLLNWYNYTLDIPTLESINLRNFWAPDIVKGDDGRYYLYFGNCQAGCNIYGYVSSTPVGPWTKLHQDDTPVIGSGFPRRGFPSLDAQFFRDDDGKIYAYWGTWVHYNGGYAVGELDGKSMSRMINGKNIPLEQTPEPFEAAYVLKHKDKYILMYSSASCHDASYNVRYSYADNPYGPFTPGDNNPILSTNADQSVHGPGHHSVLKQGEDYYIVYHRHDYPMTRGGMARQVCIDSMIFENDSTIRKVIPSHRGIADIFPSELPVDLAFGAKTKASSYYRMNSPGYDYTYKPSFATDNNNATMWKAADNSFPQTLEIDLGSVQKISRVMTQFEFASYYYQYLLEYSTNGKKWAVYADRSDNRVSGSPMIDDKEVEARFLRLKVLGAEKTGIYAAVWNIKAYGSSFDIPLGLVNKASEAGPGAASKREMLLGFEINKKNKAENLSSLPNLGTLGGNFTLRGEVSLGTDDLGVQALEFTRGSLVLDVPVPQSLAWNGSFTVATWVRNPEVGREGDCLFSWCDRHALRLANSYNALFYNRGPYGAMAHLDGHFDMRYRNLPAENEWHHIVVTFDGVLEKVYVDGVLDNVQSMILASAVDRARFIVGASDVGEHFSGYMASLRMYDYALSPKELSKLMKKTRPGNLKK
jgi:xylan 1,4-beta-xylosidase